MHDNSRLIMKKYITKLTVSLFLLVSISCFSYVNHYDNKNGVSISQQYEELAKTTDKMVLSLQSATMVFNKVVDFLTKRNVS